MMIQVRNAEVGDIVVMFPAATGTAQGVCIGRLHATPNQCVKGWYYPDWFVSDTVPATTNIVEVLTKMHCPRNKLYETSPV